MSSKINTLSIFSQKVIQNSVEFFIGKITAKELITIVSVTNRAITGFNEDGQPLYNDYIQRKPNPSRVNSIKEYLLSDQEACFPNNILISIPSILLLKEPELIFQKNELYELLIDKSKVDVLSTDKPLYLQIFDGQHRFRGVQVAIEELRGNNSDPEKLNQLENFEFTVSYFIDAEIEFQAMLFSIINRTPVKVSQDLVFDLFGLTTKDSPQKTALAIVLQLNGLKITDKGDKGPFFKRVRLLAKKEKGFDSPISQGIFVKTILNLISPTPSKAERERLDNRKQFLSGGNERTIFRDWYANDKDNNMYRTLLNYFIAVQQTFVDEQGKSYWDIGQTPENALHRTIGFLALINILTRIFPFCLQNKNISIDFFKEYLGKAKNIRLVDESGSRPYPYTSKGSDMLKKDLEMMIFSTIDN
ncbi:DGQHR domain-containing protein [Arundinibacter roseus]|uniref:DGQHR domain-containing protein n=1 Tax=Arundinibacter roseus TaxID=2070510 RepID=A0A4R4K1V3_9BACT|nr:DGQHR domain-containing protein [Arundinibacter roseus]TDB60406.1 DGQHR domain-containing protein [Arundinibacter roseus]